MIISLGGETGIRTLGTLQHTRVPGVPIQPLLHLSILHILYQTIPLVLFAVKLYFIHISSVAFRHSWCL